ncbi:YdeI/OmpD-associated family protein [Deinococcus sp.]|uniref:YdeI/OmpD-associated family protein n=1 Tax=Deinococcus sp. TaxID=47478 RepID=UPI003CC5647E
MPELPPHSFEPEDRAAWRNWLARHHADLASVWLVLHKKSAGPVNLSTPEAVEEALCFGWIDSKPRRLDQWRSLLYFAPRKVGSGWSAVNKARIAKLAASGLLHPAGLARIEAAKQDGSWSLLGSADALEVPPDLRLALEASGGLEHWNAFPRGVRRGILEWTLQAKTAPTRAKRIEETASRAAKNERANQWR